MTQTVADMTSRTGDCSVSSRVTSVAVVVARVSQVAIESVEVF